MKTPFLIASLFLLLLWPALIEGKDKPEILLYLPFDEGEGLLTAERPWSLMVRASMHAPRPTQVLPLKPKRKSPLWRGLNRLQLQ